MKERLFDYIKARMREASTWRGLALVLTAVGVPLSSDQSQALVLTGLAVSGVIGVLSKDS